MTIHFTEEMWELYDIFMPWENPDSTLKEDAPNEAKEAKEKFDKLYKEVVELEWKLLLE